MSQALLPSAIDPFWDRIEQYGECWLWTRATNRDGYGTFMRNRVYYYAHRYAYTQLVCDVPEGLELDHTCRVRSCVNPGHLDPVTPKVNKERMALAKRRTHCSKGHALQGHNLLTSDKSRRCRTCRLEHAARMRAKRKEKV